MNTPAPTSNALRRILLWGVVVFACVTIIVLLLPAVGSGPVAPSSRCRHNLFQLAIALREYHDDYGAFPPPYLADSHGQPMHSWRVLLLPYMNDGLYRMYNFAEPWDGPNNIRLLGLGGAPQEYRCPVNDGSNLAPVTNYVAVVGDETAWNARKTVTLADITDGPDNTIMLVEVADSDIYWTEPRDLAFTTMNFTINKDRKGISTDHGNRVSVLVCGGKAVQFGTVGDKECGRPTSLPDDTAPETLRALLTINGHEMVVLPE